MFLNKAAKFILVEGPLKSVWRRKSGEIRFKIDFIVAYLNIIFLCWIDLKKVIVN